MRHRPRIIFWRVVLIILIALATVIASLPHLQPSRAGGLSANTTTLAYPAPPLMAAAAALMDVDTGQWLDLSHADQPLPMASTTKIMTAVLALKHGHLSDLVTVSRAAATIGQTTMGLREGERVSVRDLLYGLLLPSGNDAGIAIAEHLAGSMARFVRMMNAQAAALHLTHTHYLNSYGFFDTPDGDDPRHYTSARDLVRLARYAMRFPLFRRIVATRQYDIPATSTHREYSLTSIDYVIYWYPGADGVKPGWTSGAGICQVVDVHRDGRHLIAALLHTPNLYTDTRDLLNYGLGDFTWTPSRWPALDTVDQTVAAADRSSPVLYFPYTGHSIRGPFLSFFRAHGGLPVFGFPRTEAVDAGDTLEQFFTNQVLSYDPRSGKITAPPLGLQAVPSRQWLRRTPVVPDTDWRTYYPQTGHTVTYRFRLFYLDEGGPATFGYPITEKRFAGKTLVQYFQNAEFIWHPTVGNGGYITLAPIGQEQLARLGLLAPPGIVPASFRVGDAMAAKTAETGTSTATWSPTTSPTATRTAAPSPTVTQSATRTPATPTTTATASPTASPRPSPTTSAMASSTATARPSPTDRPAPSRTPIGTATPTTSPTVPATATATRAARGTDTPVAPI